MRRPKEKALGEKGFNKTINEAILNRLVINRCVDSTRPTLRPQVLRRGVSL
jgi:hypothetical protein